MASQTDPLLVSDETAPLLNTGHASLQRNFDKSQSPRAVYVLVCIVMVVIDFGSYLSLAPQIAIAESLICSKAQGPGGQRIEVLEHNWNCKSPDVQGKLALLSGWKDTFDQIPGIVLALPYGWAADRFGRKPVILLSLVGLILEEIAVRLIFWWNNLIDIRAIWIAPVFQILGGGSEIATAMAYSMVTDVYLPDDRASAFFVMGAMILFAEILATPLSALLMLWDPWIPSLLGLGFQLIGLTTVAFIPETRPISRNLNGVRENDEPSQRTIWNNKYPQESWTNAWCRRWKAIRTQAAPTGSITFAMSAFLFASIGKQSVTLILQYSSQRFSLTFAAASSLITLKGVVTLTTLLVLLPRLSLVLTKHIPPTLKDLWIVRGSALALTFGAGLMAISANISLFILGICFLALGWGFYSALRSLVTALISPSHAGTVNTAIALTQSTGIMVAGPALASAFKQGMEMDDFWRGLPYMLTATLFLGTTLLTYSVHV